MILKRSAPGPKPASKRWLSRLAEGLGMASAAVTLAAGCLDRPVEPQDPSTSNVYVAEIRQTAVDKIDLLFMIDNSISMADKQAILREAVPVLLQRLVTPICVNGMGEPTGGTVPCGGGSEAEFNPIRDIHIGVVTSSLGAHGGQVCTEPKDDDKARLVASMRPSIMPPLTSWNNSGFLAWDPDTERPRNNPPGERNAEALIAAFQNHVAAAGENGCGYEASLEAVYRFLIDPEPPSQVGLITDPATMAPVATGVVFDPPDTTILQQRAAFLRHDSLVAIILLTDENDCSIRDDGQGWLVGLQQFNGAFNMPRSTSVCTQNPNAECCVSCDADPSRVPGSCGNFKADPECARGKYTPAEDNPNLRCFEQKRRFGFDLLYGINERYLPGLVSTTIPSRRTDGEGRPIMVPNPLYVPRPDITTTPRDPSLIFLAGIVGVPWQDVATPESLTGPNLDYMTYKEMVENDRWSLILGDPGDATRAPTLPRDGLMVETYGDRTMLPPHPLTNDPIAPPSAARDANDINGHESNIPDASDLQYACIFPLQAERPCGAMDQGCDCKASDAMYNRPLCNGTTQTHAKAYPGVRHLQLLKAFGERTGNSIVASVCPKSTQRTSPAYGYTPAVAAIIERLKEALRGKCLPRRLDADETGQVPCVVVEAQAPPAGMACPPCSALPGRSEADPKLLPAVYRQLADNQYCGEGLPQCESFCLCSINQFTGDELTRCQTEGTTPANISGYCYVDPSVASPATQQQQQQIVASCPATQKRLLRFTGENVPAKGAIALIACLGASISDANTTAAMP